MFTGLIQNVGTLERRTLSGTEAELLIATPLENIELGESIAIMGACLTVSKVETKGFSAFASEETLAKTGLKMMPPGSPVNVERALRVGEPMGGHIVTGHVDTRVGLLRRTPSGQAERLTMALPDPPLSAQVAPKGSVALDGVSLTVNDVKKDAFEVMVIPHTLEQTTLGKLRPGDMLNLETDVLAKYVARRLDQSADRSPGIDVDLLMRAGFMR